MKLILASSFNNGIATSELLSAFFLTLLVLGTFYLYAKRHPLLVPPLIALSIVVSVVIGWAAGSQIGGKGYGTAFASPLIALMQVAFYDQYNALWFILVFQVIGTVAGWLVFSWLALTIQHFTKGDDNTLKLKAFWVSFNPEPKKLRWQLSQIGLTSSIFLSMVFLTINLDFTAYNTGMVLNLTLLMLGTTLVGYLTRQIGYFSASSWLEIGLKTMQLLTRHRITKFEGLSTIASLIYQPSFAYIIGLIAFAIKHAQGLI